MAEMTKEQREAFEKGKPWTLYGSLSTAVVVLAPALVGLSPDF